MVQDKAKVTMADQQKVVYGLSNGTIFNDAESSWVTSKPYFKVTIIFTVINSTNSVVCDLFNGSVSNDIEWPLTWISRSRRDGVTIDALDVLCVQLTRDLFAIAKFLYMQVSSILFCSRAYHCVRCVYV